MVNIARGIITWNGSCGAINGRVIGRGIYYDYQQPVEKFLAVP